MKRILCRVLNLAAASSAKVFLFSPKGDSTAEKKAKLRNQCGERLAQLRPFVAGLLALCILCLVGCQSAKQPCSMSHASVQVKGHALEDILQTTTAVFREAGYSLVATSPVEMVFDRPGSRRDAAKWGGWSAEGVTMRVKVGLSRMTDGSDLLEAEAYAVQNSDDEFFRTERRNIVLNRRPYQKLLDEVARRMK